MPHAVLAGVTATLSQQDVYIKQVRVLAMRRLQCLELRLAAFRETDPKRLSQGLHSLRSDFGVDLVVQEAAQYRKKKRLLFIDMDSTLVQIEGIDELAREAGVGDAVVSITHRAMNGEISFPEALRERVALLRGLPVSALQRVYRRMPYTPGARRMISRLQVCGYRIALLSGGFDYFSSRVKNRLKLDHAFSNTLEVRDGALTGAIVGDIVDGRRKAALMAEIVQKEGATFDQTIAIGDGANDLPMIAQAGLGIAFRAKPAVREAAPCSITQNDLTSVLYLLGMTEEEIWEDGT
jgi:phosphoserine phosphatase